MSERLLSELFPIFVKKEYLQSQRVSKGPFGEGLEKARTYLKPGEQSPEGANVQTGPQERLSLQKAGPHKYTSRTMGANGKYVYEYSGGVQGKPDAPEGSSHEQSAAHHHEALRHHGAMAAQSGKRAEKLAAKAPDHPMTRRGQATSQGHLAAQAYHQDQFDQHQAAGAGYDPEEANRQKQGAIYGWD